jgi:hypothetical protein
MPPPSGIRLRDSCQACATSKTKCSKDKPQCIRCAKRGTSCQYLVTQRTGRKASSRSDSKDDTTPRPSSSGTTTPEPLTTQSPLEREAGPELSLLNSRLNALEAAMLPSSTDGTFSMLLTDLDFSAPVQPYDNAVDSSSVPTNYMLRTSPGGSHEITYDWSHANLTAGRSSLPNQDLGARDGDHTTFANATTSSLPNEQLFQELGNYQIQNLSLQQEGIKMALQLMRQLCCPEGSSPYANLTPLEREVSANTLMDKCRQVTSAVTDMLQSDSFKDGYCLAVVCLLMSKVLDAYVCASQALSTSGMDEQGMSLSSSSSTLSSLSATASESSRNSASPSAREGDPKAVQQLLDELYQVRGAMDLLGAKIASMPSHRDFIDASDPATPYYDTLAAALPFSAEILNQLYDAQRRRLKTISLQLINNLRAFWVEEHLF